MNSSIKTPLASSAADVLLDRLNLHTDHCAIVGMQWGDEGKGKIVDLLTSRFDLVVRYNGGANAGHSVQVGDTRYALHLIPSGILYPDKLNVISNGVVVDPAQLIKEINELRQRGIAIDGNLRLSDRAHVVLPYHKKQDGLLEAVMSKQQGDSNKIGTTGRGIGPCYADKALRSTAIRVCDLLEAQRCREKLTQIVKIKNLMLKGLADECGEAFEPFDAATLCDELLGYAQTLKPFITDTTQLLHDSIDAGKRILFEGANATLLDVDHGTYPYVTSSNCSSLGVHTGAAMPGRKVPQVLGIMKAYQTRVGGGPMPTELHDDTGHRIRERGKEYGTTTGRPRRCGWLDLVTVKYSATISGATGLGLMLFDVLAGLPTLKICTGYRYQGKTLTAFPADAAVLAQVEPIYQQMPGFSQSISECRSFGELPIEAQQYVQMVEQHVGVPVRIISVGPRRDQTLVR